jgi:hypothetical protein
MWMLMKVVRIADAVRNLPDHRRHTMAHMNDKTTEMAWGRVGPLVTSAGPVKNAEEVESLVGVARAQSCHPPDQYPVKKANRRG